MSKVEAISLMKEQNNAKACKNESFVKKEESFTDALKKMRHSKIKENQGAKAGLIALGFASGVLFFGDKLKLHKLGLVGQIIGCASLLSGVIGLLISAETYGKKVERKIAKLFENSENETNTVAKENLPKKVENNINKNDNNKVLPYQALDLHLSQN